MKKRMGFIAASLAVLLSFTSCSSAGSAKVTTYGKTSTPTQLTVAFIAAGNTPADLAKVEAAINKITVPKINVSVKFLVLNFGNAMQQYNLMLSSNQKLDLMITYPYTYGSLVTQGKIQDITSLVNKYGSQIKAAEGKFLKGGYVNNKLYGLRPICDEGAGAGLCIRKDILQKYKLHYSNIKSLADIGNLFAQIKAHDPNQPILTYQNQNMGLYESYGDFTTDSLGDNFGVLMNYGQNLKVVDQYETKDYANFVKLMRQWYLKGYIMKDIATNKDDQHTLVKAGKAIAYFTPTKAGIAQQESAQDGYTMVVPQFSIPLTITNTTWEWVVPTNCKTPDKAVQLLNMMFSNADLENLMSWGIEGKHYVKKSDGTIGFPAGVTDKTSGFYVNQPWMMGNEFLTHVWTGNPSNLWDQMKKFNSTCVTSKAFGFSYDSSPVKTQITALSNVYSSYKLALESGSVDPTTVLPDFISRLKASGINTVVAEKQRQLNAWAKKNNVK